MKVLSGHKSGMNLSFLLLFLVAVSIFSCKKDEVISTDYTNLKAAPKIVKVGEKAGSAKIKVYANGQWIAKVADSSKDWLDISNQIGVNGEEGTIEATYKDNSGNLPRMAKIAVALNDETDTIIFRQEGYAFISFDNDTVFVKAKGKDESVKLNTNIPLNQLKYSVKFVDGKDWVVDDSLDKGYLNFNVVKNESNTRIAQLLLSFNDAIGNLILDTLIVVQKSIVESADLKTFSYVKTRLSDGEIAENSYIEGVIISDKGNPNMAINPNTSKTDIDKTVNDKTVYIQSLDGKLGLKLMTKTVDDNIFEKNTIVKLWLKGLTVVKNSNPDFVTLDDIQTSNVIATEANPNTLVPRELYMKDLTDDDLFTYVKLKQVKISIPDGSFTNINEGYNGRADTYAMSIRDINGNSMYMLFNYGVSYRRSGPVPQGSGEITGILVHEDLPRYGNVGAYQIRPTERSDIDLAEDAGNSFSKVLVKWTRYKGENESGATASQNPLTPDVGSGTLSASQSTPFDYGYYGGIYDENDYNGLTTDHKGIVNDGAFGTWNWWGTTEGNYWLIKVSSAGITTPISIQFDGNNKIGGPRNWVLQWSSTGGSGSWNTVSDFTFPDVVSWGNTLYTQLPGFKSYSFELPVAASGLPTLYVRLQAKNKIVGTSTSADGGTMSYTGRSMLGYISLEYNK